MAASLIVAAPAMADERVCRGTIGAQTVDDLRVLDGAACRLTGTRVEGTISVGTGARLVARNRIGGNLQCKENRGRPAGGLNVVEGNREDQCARL